MREQAIAKPKCLRNYAKTAILQFLLMLKQTILWLHLARIAIMNLQYYSQIILKIDLINNIC